MKPIQLIRGIVVACVLAAAAFLSAAEIPGEELLPENSVVSIVVADLRAVQGQFEKSRLAEVFAQPMMQEFLQPVLQELKAQQAETLKANPAAFSFTPALFDGSLAAAVFASPRDPNDAGIVAVFTPRTPADFLAALPPALAKGLKDGTFAHDPLNDTGIEWVKDRLIFCAPAEQLARFKAQLAPDAAPRVSLAQDPAYKTARERLAGSLAFVYAAPQPIFALATSELHDPAELHTAKSIWSVTGLDRMNSASVGLGFKNGELVAEGFAGLSAPDAGVFGLLYKADAPPLNAAALKIAAPNAPFVTGGYFNFAGILPLLKAGIAAADPRMAAALDGQLQAVAQVLQFDLQKDFLANIDGAFVAAQTESNTSLPVISIPGMVYSFGAKDPAKLAECLGKFEAFLGNLPEPLKGRIKLKKSAHLDKAIYYLSGPIIPLSPSLCIHDGRLLMGTSLNAMRRSLEQLQKNEDILGNKNFQQALSRITGQPFSADKIPAAFSYGQDQGSGEGALLLAVTYLSAAGVLQIINASLPVPPGVNPAADMKANESAAIVACTIYAEAQEIFARTDYDKDDVLEYAQALKGDQSLLEVKAGAGDLALIAKEFADAEGEPDGKTQCKGYRFKLLKSALVEGAKKPYVVNGNMTDGYALLAYPAQHGVSGKRSFIISDEGTVYGADWGAKTAEKAAGYSVFDPTGFEAAEAADADGEPALQDKRVEAVTFALMRKIDLGFWPDQAFFEQYRRPVAAAVRFDPAGIYWRSELPPPMPKLPRMDAAPIYIIGGGAIVAGLTLPVLARARESARRTSSASNLHQIGKAAVMFADDPANGGKYPAHAAQLFPRYVADVKVFRNPRFPNEDVGFVWVSGLDPNMATEILAYEEPPPTDHSGGRNVLVAGGSVEWVDEAGFQRSLEATKEAIKAAKREMKLIPISVREVLGEKGAPPPPEF